MEPNTTSSSSVQSPGGGTTLQGAEQRAKNEGGSASGDKATNNEQQQQPQTMSASSSQGPTPSPSSSSSIPPSNTTNTTTTTTSMCLAGLGTYVERLCGLCEAGSSMGALWTQCLESGGSAGDGMIMLQRLNTILADLNSLAQLEATQLNMSVERANKTPDKTKAVLGCVREFVLLQQQFFQFGAEQLSQLLLQTSDPDDPVTADNVDLPTPTSTTPGHSSSSSANKLKIVGSLASQEELDSVIDMLSNSSIQHPPHLPPSSNKPQVLPTHPHPHHHRQQQQLPPSLPYHQQQQQLQQHLQQQHQQQQQFINRNMFSQPPPPLPPRDKPPPPLPPRAQGPPPPSNIINDTPSHTRQRSDSGLVGVGGAGDRQQGVAKTNTWPFRPREGGATGAGGGGGNGGSASGQMFGGAAYDGFNTDLEYSQYLEAVKAVTGQRSVMSSQPPPPLQQQGQGMYSPWSNTAQWGADPTGGWSGGGGIEESSCSDESSTNGVSGTGGEHFVHRRRHSSGGEKKFAPSINMPPPPALDDEALLASMDGKSHNTWPPKQVWSVKPATPPPVHHQQQYPQWATADHLHKPLGGQWSDPLQQRGGAGALSLWEPGPGSFDGLGAVNTPTASAERKHSLM